MRCGSRRKAHAPWRQQALSGRRRIPGRFRGDFDVSGGASVELGSPAACAGEGVEALPVGFGQCVQVLLCGLDLGVPHPFHDAPEVGSVGEQPGGVCVAEVVHADGEVDSAGFDGGLLDPGVRKVLREIGVPVLVVFRWAGSRGWGRG